MSKPKQLDPAIARAASTSHYHCSIYEFSTPTERRCDLAGHASLEAAVMFTGIPAEVWIATHPVKQKKVKAERSEVKTTRKKAVNIWEQLRA